MKKTVSELCVLEKIFKYQPEMKGVYTTADLYNLMGAQNPIANQRAIQRLVQAGSLERAMRGVYVANHFDANRLVSVLFPEAYISLDTALVSTGLMHTIRKDRFSIVTYRRKTASIRIQNTFIDVYSVAKKIFFGFKKNQDGDNVACPEKAFLDVLYFHLRGYKFLFDPKTEVDISSLDKKIVKKYLREYGNPKFVSFVEGVLHDQI